MSEDKIISLANAMARGQRKIYQCNCGTTDLSLFFSEERGDELLCASCGTEITMSDLRAEIAWVPVQ